MPGPLGRRAPTDWQHVERYPLTAANAPAQPSPVVLGVNWYVEFDKPEKDAQGHYGSPAAASSRPCAAATACASSPPGAKTRTAGGTSTTNAKKAPASDSGSAA